MSGGAETSAEQMNEINRMLGALREAVDHMTSQWHVQETAAVDGRQRLQDKFDSLRDEVRDLKSRVDQMGRQIEVIQPSIQRYNERRLREEGARQFGTVIWGAILTAAGLTGWAISTFVHWMFGKSPL